MSFYRQLLGLSEVTDAAPRSSGSGESLGNLKSFIKAVGEDFVTAASGGTMTLSDFSWLRDVFRYLRGDANVAAIAKKYNLSEDKEREELAVYKRHGYAPSWVIQELSKLFSDKYFAAGGRRDYAARGSAEAAEAVAKKIDTKGLQSLYGTTPDARETNLQRLLSQMQKDGVPVEAGRTILGVSSAPSTSSTSTGQSPASTIAKDDILQAKSPTDMSAWSHSSLALKPIGYGRTVLPRGTYLLSSAGVTAQSLEDYTFKFPISAVLNWKAFTQWVSKAWTAADMDAWAAARRKAIDESATKRLQGVDFMTKLQRNPVSGDIEFDLGYLPRGDYKNLFILNVGKDSAFTLSVWADSLQLVSVV